MISPAFYDELEKIAEEQTDHDFITKDRVKRLGKTMLLAGAGTGIGAGLGSLAGRMYWKHKIPDKLPFLKKHGPMIAGGLGGLGTMLAMMHRSNADHYIRYGKKPDDNTGK